MTLVIPLGYAHVGIEHRLTGYPRAAFTTYGVEVPTGSPFQDVANSIFTAHQTAMKGVLDTDVRFMAAHCSFGTDGEPFSINSNLASVQGTAPLTSLPGNCAVLVQKFTARGGRRGRGRMYLPWAISEGSVDEAGTIVAAGVTGIQTAVNALLSGLDAAGLTMTLLHNEAGSSAPGAPDAVTSAAVSGIISNQRRRIVRTSF